MSLEQANPCAPGQAASTAHQPSHGQGCSPGAPDRDSKALLKPFCLFLGLVSLKRCGFVSHGVLAQLRGVAQSLQAALKSLPSWQMQTPSLHSLSPSTTAL